MLRTQRAPPPILQLITISLACCVSFHNVLEGVVYWTRSIRGVHTSIIIVLFAHCPIFQPHILLRTTKSFQRFDGGVNCRSSPKLRNRIISLVRSCVRACEVLCLISLGWSGCRGSLPAHHLTLFTPSPAPKPPSKLAHSCFRCLFQVLLLAWANVGGDSTV